MNIVAKFIFARDQAIDFLPEKTNENTSEWISFFTHNVNYRLSFNDWMNLETIRAALQSPRVPVIEILETVLEQAEDDGLWFNAKYASEGYLQQELRRLHAVIERAYAELQKGV